MGNFYSHNTAMFRFKVQLPSKPQFHVFKTKLFHMAANYEYRALFCSHVCQIVLNFLWPKHLNGTQN